MTTHDDVIRLATLAGIDKLHFQHQGKKTFVMPLIVGELTRLIDLVRAEENEACAIVAWGHYADMCKCLKMNPHHYGEWIASNAIRERMNK